VVTGLGAVSALGWGVTPLWEALRAGRTGLGPFSRFEHSRQRTHLAGQVPDGPSTGLRLPRGFKRLSFAERFSVFAAAEAMAQAEIDDLQDRDAGVFFGTSTGGLLESERFLDRLWGEGKVRGGLGLMAGHQLNAPGDTVARHLGVRGPVETISSACASAALAIGSALRALRRGEVDLALAGGGDCLCATTYSGFNSLRSVDERPCRPFRAGRTGLSLGEGAAVLVLETHERATARGARIRAELMGVGASCDASHMTAPHPEGRGAASALTEALRDAGLPADAISFINAHGTGTPLNDASEWAAFAETFGERARRLPVSASKSIVGHLLGSSGAIEAVATVLCLEAALVHPAAGDGPVDPALPVDLVLGAPRPVGEDAVAISTSLGFGGANAAVVLARRDGRAV
jgi:3-oxoacyl-[acyl-carrier-protein] synthase II